MITLYQKADVQRKGWVPSIGVRRILFIILGRLIGTIRSPSGVFEVVALSCCVIYQ